MIIKADVNETLLSPPSFSSFQQRVVAAIKENGGWGGTVELSQNPRYVTLSVPSFVFGSDAKLEFRDGENGMVRVKAYAYTAYYASVEEAVEEGLLLFREEFAKRLAGQMFFVVPSTKWELVQIIDDEEEIQK